MKKSFVIIVLMSLMGVVLAGSVVCARNEDEQTCENLIVKTIIKRPVRDRSLGPAVEAWYFPETATIAVTCYGSKETSIYIIDSSGDVAVRDSYDFTISPDCTVYAPIEEGEYWLVLDSEELYAEGVFEVE